jgi:hypothetical protein
MPNQMRRRRKYPAAKRHFSAKAFKTTQFYLHSIVCVALARLISRRMRK